MAVFVGIAWTGGTLAESSVNGFDSTGGVATGLGTTFKRALPIAALFLYAVVSVLRRAARDAGTGRQIRIPLRHSGRAVYCGESSAMSSKSSMSSNGRSVGAIGFGMAPPNRRSRWA